MRLRERARHKSWTDSIYLSLYLRQCWYRGCHRDNAPWCSLAWYLSLRRAEGQDTRRSHAHVHSRPAAAAWYSKREGERMTLDLFILARTTRRKYSLCVHTNTIPTRDIHIDLLAGGWTEKEKENMCICSIYKHTPLGNSHPWAGAFVLQ